MKRLAALLIVLGLTAVLFTGCGDGVSSDPKVIQLGQDVGRNTSKLFPNVSDLKEIKAPVAVIVSEEGGKYKVYKGGKLATAADLESAKSVLVLETRKNDDGKIWGWDVKLGTADGALSISLNTIKAEKLSQAEEKLLADYAFSEGAEDLPSIIKDYETKLFAEDYLTAINKSADSYADLGQGLNNIDLSEIREPLVYFTDKANVVKAVGGDIDFIPAEWSQYVPGSEHYTTYRRPNIEGDIGLGFTGLGQPATGQGGQTMSTTFTVDEIKRRISTPSDAFCVSEVVGSKYYATLTLKKDNSKLTLNTYVFRVSVIKKDGTLLGYVICSSEPLEDDLVGFGTQMAAVTMSYDKHDRIVVPWGYLSVFWKKASDGK